MQITNNSTSYNVPQAQLVTGATDDQDPSTDGQNSPGANTQYGPPGPPPTSPGGQFDPATLGSLLSLQQQQSTDGSTSSSQAAGQTHHHHGHHHHGGKGGVEGGQGGAQATSTTSQSTLADSSTTTSETLAS